VHVDFAQFGAHLEVAQETVVLQAVGLPVELHFEIVKLFVSGADVWLNTPPAA
jgi:hypothetical protein